MFVHEHGAEWSSHFDFWLVEPYVIEVTFDDVLIDIMIQKEVQISTGQHCRDYDSHMFQGIIIDLVLV
jgi:hypothetical protein